MRNKTRKNRKSSNYLCEKGKTLEECELEIVRQAVDNAEKNRVKN